MPPLPEAPAGPPSMEIVESEDRDGVLVRDVKIDGSIEAYLVEPAIVDARTVRAGPGLRPLVRHARAERQPDRVPRRGGRLDPCPRRLGGPAAAHVPVGGDPTAPPPIVSGSSAT